MSKNTDKSHPTIFDRILQGEIPCDRVFENAHVLAFRDIRPQAPVHILVIPKLKVVAFSQLDQLPHQAVGDFFRGIAATALHLGLEKNGYRVVFNEGRDGQQTVDYLHAHILAGRPLHWPPG